MKNINLYIFISFILVIVLLWQEYYKDAKNTLTERSYYASIINTLTINSKVEKTNNDFNIIDYGWIPFKITKNKDNLNFVNENSNKIKINKKIKNNWNILNLKEIDTKSLTISMPKYIKTTKIIIPETNFTIYNDLKQGVRLSPNAHLPNEKGITFLEWHSWINFENWVNYSFFDNIALYYDKIEYKTPITIENDNYIFEYELFKKEIIKPWTKDFYDSNFHHLILMTCYPRNTTTKRALLHAKLKNIIKK